MSGKLYLPIFYFFPNCLKEEFNPLKSFLNNLHYCSYLFGSDVVAQFNQANDVEMICRAHQLVMEGYKWHFNETVLTVWSAPNYCYR